MLSEDHCTLFSAPGVSHNALWKVACNQWGVTKHYIWLFFVLREEKLISSLFRLLWFINKHTATMWNIWSVLMGFSSRVSALDSAAYIVRRIVWFQTQQLSLLNVFAFNSRIGMNVFTYLWWCQSSCHSAPCSCRSTGCRQPSCDPGCCYTPHTANTSKHSGGSIYTRGIHWAIIKTHSKCHFWWSTILSVSKG